MTNLEFAKQLKNGLFADRPTVREAFDYAFDVADASDNPAAVFAAVMVVANTIANQIIENEKETLDIRSEWCYNQGKKEGK